MKFRTKLKLKIGGIYYVDSKPWDDEKYNYDGRVKIIFLGSYIHKTPNIPRIQQCFWHTCKLLDPHSNNYTELRIAECFFKNKIPQ